MIWTDPNRQHHSTRPGSYGLFPQLCRPTARAVLSATQLAAAAEKDSQPGRGLAAPRRRRTRAQDRSARIAAERRFNETQPQPSPTATATQPAPTWDDYFDSWPTPHSPGDDDDPPPF